MGEPATTSGSESLAAKIGCEKGHPPARKTAAKRAVAVPVAGFTIYLAFAAVTEVAASWTRLSTLDPRWFALRPCMGPWATCLGFRAAMAGWDNREHA